MGGDYEVGYGRPPKSGRFRKGQSGNPKGRPKGTKNLKTDLLEELGEKLVIKEAGKSKMVSKQRAFIKTLASRALSGDPRSMTLLANLVLRLMGGEQSPIVDVDLTEADQMILEQYRKEILEEAARAAERGDQHGH